MRRYLVMVIMLSGCGASSLQAQRFATIQLPSFRRFSINTTVSVPDRGGMQLGGVGRSWQRSTRRGRPFWPGGNRSRASGTASTSVSVHATIHDLTELDEAVMQEWRASKPAGQRAALSPAARWQVSAQADPARRPQRTPTIRQLRDRAAAEEQARQAQAAADYQAGRRLERQGKTGAAKIYYGMALKRAEGGLREQVVARLASLTGTRFVQR